MYVVYFISCTAEDAGKLNVFCITIVLFVGQNGEMVVHVELKVPKLA